MIRIGSIHDVPAPGSLPRAGALVVIDHPDFAGTVLEATQPEEGVLRVVSGLPYHFVVLNTDAVTWSYYAEEASR